MRAQRDGDRRELADRRAGRDRARGHREARRLPALARRRQLHLPRLPRLRAIVQEDGEVAARRRCPGPGWGSCASRSARTTARRGLRRAAARRARAARRALPAEPHEGQLARHRPPPRLPRLRRRQALRRGRERGRRAALPRPLHARRLPRQPARHPDPAPQGRRDPRRAPRSRPAATTRRRCIQILETYPRDELIQTSVDELFEIAMGILHLGERQRVRLFVRARRLRPLPLLPVFVPRDRFNTEQPAAHRAHPARGLRRAEHRLHHARLRVGARAPALHAPRRARADAASPTPPRSRRGSSRPPARGPTTWRRRWSRSTARSAGNALCRRYGDAFPPAYRADWVARSAVADIARIESLRRGRRSALSLYRPLEARARRAARQGLSARARRWRSPTCCRCSRTWASRSPTSGRTSSSRATAPPAWIYDFGLHLRRASSSADAGPRAPSRTPSSAPGAARSRTTATTASSCAAGLTWREVTVLRAVGALPAPGRHDVQRPLRRAGARRPPRRRGHADRAVPARASTPRAPTSARPTSAVARDRARRSTTSRASTRTASCAASSPSCRRCCAPTTSSPADDGRSPTCRSSSTRRSSPGCRCRARSSRSSSTRRASRACTCAAAGSRAAGCAGRTGARTSAPRSSGLMKAQMVKNAVIVPVGRQGRLRRQAPAAAATARTCSTRSWPATGRSSAACSTSPTTSSDGEVVPPPRGRAPRRRRPLPRRRRRQGHGDASPTSPTRSPREYGFWLGDAFASGGSSGYDHKAMGITARGAWESVKRHFRELGHDIQTEDFTVVGVGDMSGDVFGNGMLLSHHIRLVAAFDHRHVFLDPDPDPARELRRAAAPVRAAALVVGRLRPALISEGGGVFPRTREVDPAVRRRSRDVAGHRGRGADAERADPRDAARAGRPALERRHRHLREGERRDARRRRRQGQRRACASTRASCAAAWSARAATSASPSARGSSTRSAAGAINTDAIDNSAGVDCSDHEVNIKILLDAAVADGRPDRQAAQRAARRR